MLKFILKSHHVCNLFLDMIPKVQEIPPFATRWMDLEVVMLSKITLEHFMTGKDLVYLRMLVESGI